MKKIPRIFLPILLAVMLAGCFQSGPSSGPKRNTALLPTPTPTPNISSPLIGTYTTTVTSKDVAGHPELNTGYMQGNAGGMAIPGMWYLTFRSDGIWIAQDNNEYGRQYIGTGMFKIDGNRVMLLTDSKCLEYYVPLYGSNAQFATYTWQLQGNTLLLQTTGDLCLPRHIVLASHTWMRVSQRD
ncbi:MAG TPA: hypothetical protein VKV20_04345 [Ktedonobacteraceae bacterium]|nr:hypothetical protein [Ktedonobacteraceae bacterium]